MSVSQTSSTGGGTHAPGCYYVNIVDGAIQRQCNPILATALGAAGYFGCDNLPANPANACPTFAAAQAFASSHSITAGVTSFLDPVLMPFNAIGNFFGMLTSRQTLIRIAEGILGITLLWVGVSYFIRQSDTFKEIKGSAVKAGKAAVTKGV